MDAHYTYHPTKDVIDHANITQWMRSLSFETVSAFHHWTVSSYEDFWQRIIAELKIVFHTKPSAICNISHGVESPDWLVGATLNIVDSCFTAAQDKPAIYYLDESNHLISITYGELEQFVNRIANSLIHHGFKPTDAIAIIMPMNIIAVASYLAVIRLGGIVVSIADSFSAMEIRQRLTIANAVGVITQDVIHWGGKPLALYTKLIEANAPRCVVVSDHPSLLLRDNDVTWNSFLSNTTTFASAINTPITTCNLLFSSGTTGTPKAIPWNHTTPIKVASDAYFHHNIKANDILAWPTSLGWMMGPWLVFAALINQAAIALYTNTPNERPFGQFIQDAKVTMLGVVPSLVANWKQTHCMEGLDWQHIKVFSSTGECSNPVDMAYLMQLAGGKPVIEYCGGTEIGGGYISSTVVQDNYPSLFSTPTMGTRFIILDGEVAIVPPALGLSTHLLNADHHLIYYANMPTIEGMTLRRHGDQLEELPNGYYRLLGRTDDTMNLSGIKVSSAEIERTLVSAVEGIVETAAIAIQPTIGPHQLVIFAETKMPFDKALIKDRFQQVINQQLNPLFRIYDVVLVESLPKTASNKIMRRVLREQYK